MALILSCIVTRLVGYLCLLLWHNSCLLCGAALRGLNSSYPLRFRSVSRVKVGVYWVGSGMSVSSLRAPYVDQCSMADWISDMVMSYTIVSSPPWPSVTITCTSNKHYNSDQVKPQSLTSTTQTKNQFPTMSKKNMIFTACFQPTDNVSVWSGLYLQKINLYLWIFIKCNISCCKLLP